MIGDLRRVDVDQNYLNYIIEKSVEKKDSILYRVSEKVGQGNLESFLVMSGVEIIYNDFVLNNTMKKDFNIDTHCIEITYCLKGNIEIKFRNNKYAYITDGDICMCGYKTQAVSCDFGMKKFKGITVMLYLPQAMDSLKKVLGSESSCFKDFFQNVLSSDTCIIQTAKQSIEHIFKELFVLPDKHKISLLKLKISELLLYIESDLDYKKNSTVYFSKDASEKIKEARKVIIDNLDKCISVKDISDMIHMNVTDLEKGFKSIYGATIFVYSRQCRMQKAKELLIDTRESVLDIGIRCGYTNGGKFAKVFKEAYGVTPSKYRSSLI